MSTRLKSWRLWRLLLLAGTVVALVGLTLPPDLVAIARPPAQSEGESRNVLLLNSYHHGLSWTDNIVAAVRAAVLDPERNPFAERTELYVEYMDTKRNPMNDGVDARWRAYLAEKYAALPLDVIIVSDNDAYNFLRRHSGELFPQTPVVFCGVNFFQDADLDAALDERFTGVVEKVDFLSTLEVALHLQPDTQRIVVINDATTTGLAVQQELEAVLPAFEGITFEMLIDPTLSDLERLRSLPNDALVLLVLLNRDGDGRFYTYEQSIDLLMQQTDRPIYGVWDFYLGRGLVGGMLTNAGLQGDTAGDMALRLLTGASIGDIPIVRESPNRYMFDYEQLRRFGISLSQVPNIRRLEPGTMEAVILNRRPSFLQAYGSAIGVGLAVLAVAGVVVLLQRSYLQRQRSVAAELQAANAALERSRASMEAQVAARTEDLERRSRQFQIAAAVAREVAGGALGRGAGSDGGTGSVRETGSRRLESLLQRVANLISESFGFYQVGVFLVDEVREYAVLHAASSPGGQAMARRGHRLRVGGPGRGTGQGIVGYVAGRGEARIALDVGRDEVWRQTAELGETQSEMALPLKIRGTGGTRDREWIIGVLDMQARERAAFKQDDVEVLEIVADQLALAIQTARLLEESQRALERMEQAYSERVRAQWYRVSGERAYGFDGVVVQPLTEVSSVWQTEGDDAATEVHDSTLDRLEIPIPLRGEIVGSIVLKRDAALRPWLPEERALAETIGMQAGLSLESAQLLSESRMQAQRQRIQGEIVSRMRETLDMDLILQTALREMGQSLGIAAIEVRMSGGRQTSPQTDD